MHVANKTVRWAMHWAVRQRQEQALQQQFILHDNNNKTYYINATINLNLTMTMKQLNIINFSILMLKLLLLCCRCYGRHHRRYPNLCHRHHCHTPPPLPGMHLTMRLVVAS